MPNITSSTLVQKVALKEKKIVTFIFKEQHFFFNFKSIINFENCKPLENSLLNVIWLNITNLAEIFIN